jgi:hypothetical protein
MLHVFTDESVFPSDIVTTSSTDLESWTQDADGRSAKIPRTTTAAAADHNLAEAAHKRIYITRAAGTAVMLRSKSTGRALSAEFADVI